VLGKLLQIPKLLRLRAFRGGSLQIRDNKHPQGTRPQTDFRACATTTQEEQYEEGEIPEEHPAQVEAMYHVPHPGFMIPRPHSVPVSEDF
jgi:hypothetical protein